MTFLERLRETFAQLADVIPAMLGALVILFAGYLLAKLIEQGAERLLHRIRLNQALERGGAHFNPTKVIGKTLFWILMFGVIMVAATALGMESLASVFTELVGYLPSLMAAIVIMIAGIVLGRFTGGLIMASAGAVQGAPTLARVGRLGVIMLSVFMALQELGIATDIVTTAFAILFGAVAFGLALAFGLGNRELAGQITREWYQRYRAESDDSSATSPNAQVGVPSGCTSARSKPSPLPSLNTDRRCSNDVS